MFLVQALLDWFSSFWHSIDWGVAAQFLVAFGTLALAATTFWAIFQTRKWNRRNEMRFLPVLRFIATGQFAPGKLEGFPRGWFNCFTLEAENTSLISILDYQIISAFQGKSIFTWTNRGFFESGTISPGQHWAIDFTLSGSPPSIEKGEPPPIKIGVVYYDILFREIRIDYILELQLSTPAIGVTPRITSITVDGEKKKIPADMRSR